MPIARPLLAALAAAVLLASPVFAANRKVDIVNKTGKTLTHFYASTTNENSWEEDMLDKDVIADGETFEADIDDGTGKCIFDFKGVFENGAELVKRKVNVCEISTFTFRP
jgi:hypothetical protein